MQPEDHVSAKHIAKEPQTSSLITHRFLKVSHNASIFGAGVILFLAQEFTLNTLEPHSKGDFAQASVLATAASGAVGGASYSVCATGTAAWLGTGDNTLLQLRSWPFMRRALPFTVPRDAGGFACYFGVYKLTQDAATRWLPRHQPALSASEEPSHKLRLRTATPIELARGLAVAAASGGLAGFATYLWRSPWDTLYKRSVGWRTNDAPLWSFQRFLSSPRGLKAMLIGASTWSMYEVADAALRAWAIQS